MSDGLLNALFVKAVREMREAQKGYFKARTKDALIDGKQKETLVDKWLRDYDQGLLNYYGEN